MKSALRSALGPYTPPGNGVGPWCLLSVAPMSEPVGDNATEDAARHGVHDQSNTQSGTPMTPGPHGDRGHRGERDSDPSIFVAMHVKRVIRDTVIRALRVVAVREIDDDEIALSDFIRGDGSC